MNRPTLSPWPYPLWIGHRGAGKDAPENTLVAFQRGWSAGFRMFECDVKLSADGVPYLLHDATLDRTTNARGGVEALNWADLAALDAGGWHSDVYAGEPLLRLDALADWCLDHQASMNLEIKPVPGHEAATGAAVARAAQALWAQVDVQPLLSSFQVHALQAAQQAAPELPRALLLDRLWAGWADAARQLQVVGLVVQHRLIDQALVDTARRQGWRMLSYTVNEVAQAQRLLQLGLDGLITDRMQLPTQV
jgi:glycerophosphoryl diester phosphodiesterase